MCFRGYQVMNRYYNNPEATADTIDGRRWLHSGDLGTMDEEGYVKITGRIKEMVIRGGENLYPREIEEFVRTHPKVHGRLCRRCSGREVRRGADGVGLAEGGRCPHR